MTSMSDFFGGLNSGNIRFTDARINGDGPLPTSLSGPEGINGDPDGRYNFNEALLSGILPYAGPKAGRMGSDRNYQQIPHRKQYPVPKIYLPEPNWDTDQVFDMSHPIDMGDLVFIVNCNHKQFLLEGKLMVQTHAADNTMPNYNAFVNVCTVNYILKGISVYVQEYVVTTNLHLFDNAKEKHAWYKLLFCLGLDTELKRMRDEHDKISDLQEKKLFLWGNLKLMLQSVIRDHIKPYGVCSTSEKQGGQHETGYKPVQAAASFYVTLTVDGQNRDVVNIWRGVDVKGGDFLILQLDLVKCPTKYVLNHYYKGYIQRAAPRTSTESSEIDFQLVPGVNSSAFSNPFYFSENLSSVLGLVGPWSSHDANNVINWLNLYNNRINGYWHIGQTYSMKQKFDSDSVPHDDMAMTRGPIMQINFAPVWQGRQQDLTQNLHRHLNSDEDMQSFANTLLKSAGDDDSVLKIMYGYILCDLHSIEKKTKKETFEKFVREINSEGDAEGLEFQAELASGATAASMSLNLGTEQRFKKARVDGAQEDGSANSVVVAPLNLTKENANAGKNGDWDFEADLAAIFDKNASGEESAGGKTIKKPKTIKNP